MTRKFARLASSAKVTSPKGHLNWRDRVWSWCVGIVFTLIEFCTDLGEFLDQCVINVAELLIPELTAQAKDATAITVKVLLFLSVGYLIQRARRNRGGPTPDSDPRMNE